MSDSEKEIVEGFNAGYVIEKYRSDLYQQLSKSLEGVDTPYFGAFIEGGKESIKERELSRSKAISRLRKFTRPSRDRSKDKDKGFDIER